MDVITTIAYGIWFYYYQDDPTFVLFLTGLYLAGVIYRVGHRIVKAIDEQGVNKTSLNDQIRRTLNK